MRKSKKIFLTVILSFCILLTAKMSAQAQTTSFTYQGKLTDNNLAANGSYQMQFALFDAASGGSQLGATLAIPAVQVTNGVFTVNLDFGANAFSGANRFLEISIYSNSTNSFVVLNPRQAVTSAPYSIKSLNSTNADNSNNLGGIAASQYVQTTDARLSDARNPLAGSANYIQNTTALQSADFNLNGNGAANIFSAQFQYNIGPNRVLSVAGTNNTFVGLVAGAANAGSDNSFFGSFAGASNTTGSFNVFIGNNAGSGNVSGSNLTLIGADAGVGAANLTNATAIGAGAIVSGSNTIVLGKNDTALKVPSLATLSIGLLCVGSDGTIIVCPSSLQGGDDALPFKTQIEAQARQIQQQQVIDGLKKLVCAENKTAQICQ